MKPYRESNRLAGNSLVTLKFMAKRLSGNEAATWTNWAGSVTSRPQIRQTPSDPMALHRILDQCVAQGHNLRVVGAGHSFSPAAATNGALLSLDNFDQLERIIPIAGTQGECAVTVGAGIRLHALNALLASHGLAMANLGDIDRQSIAGAISTGTHGTGLSLTGFSAQVLGLRLMLASGEVVETSATQNAHLFQAARLSLGSIGIVIALTLRAVPAFLLHARETPLPLGEVLEHLDGVGGYPETNDHFEFYWFPGSSSTLSKFNNRVPNDTPLTAQEGSPAANMARSARLWLDDELLSNGVFQFTNSLTSRIPGLTNTINTVASKALSAREYVAASHDVFVSPRRVRFHEMEYAIDRGDAREVLGEYLKFMSRKQFAVSFPIEVRFAAKDDVWLSTAYERESIYIAVHQYQNSPYRDYFAAAEQIFKAANGRPHWGKMHTLTHEDLRTRYPRLDEFTALRSELDPTGVFGNHYTNTVFGRR